MISWNRYKNNNYSSNSNIFFCDLFVMPQSHKDKERHHAEESISEICFRWIIKPDITC